jgi:hypothetical protein
MLIFSKKLKPGIKLIMIVFKIFWFLQKILVRSPIRIFPSQFKFSARISQSDSINVEQISQEALRLNHYKIAKSSDFRRILKITRPALNPKTGLLWLDKKIVVESTLWNYEDLRKLEPCPIFPRKIDGEFLSLPDNSFFHFLIEDLPRYLQARSLKKESITIAGSQSKYIVEILNTFTGGNYLFAECATKPEFVYISEKITGQLFSSFDLDILKQNFSQYLIKSERQNIFISRKDISGTKHVTRGINLKNTIEEVFVNKGFKIVYFEEMSLFEQIALCQNANVIAGYHGAGLANIIWAERGTRIIEITRSRVTRHFEHISKICSLNYSLYSIQYPLLELSKLIDEKIA